MHAHLPSFLSLRRVIRAYFGEIKWLPPKKAFYVQLIQYVEGVFTILNRTPVMIDVEFYGITEVTNAWKVYKDHLDLAQKIESDAKTEWKNWGERREELLTALLREMASHLNFKKIDPVQLKRGHYNPKGNADLATEQQLIRKGLVDMFVNKKPLPVLAIVADVPQVNDMLKRKTQGESD